MQGVRYTLSIAFIFLISGSILWAVPRKLTWEDLSTLKDGKIPKNAMKEIYPFSLFGPDNPYDLKIYSPRGQAASFANKAEEDFVKLDSLNYNPDKFNKYVKIYVNNHRAKTLGRHGDIRQITRCVLGIGESHYDADSTVFVKTRIQNSTGADFTNTDVVFYFRIDLFSDDSDITIYIYDDAGRTKFNFKKKDINNLE